MKTRRELEWNAWEEKPRSMRATAQVARSAIQLRRRFTGEATEEFLPLMDVARRFLGMSTSIVNRLLNAILEGTFERTGRCWDMNGGFR